LSTTAAITPGTSGTTNQGVVDFVNHLISLRDALNAGDATAVAATQPNLTTTEDGFVSDLAEAGAVQMRIEVNQSQQADQSTNLQQLVSTEVDADMPSTIVKLNQASTSYQAALQSASKIMSISLLDYLK
jgi:flagellar hook-associated protein 3 FlgL